MRGPDGAISKAARRATLFIGTSLAKSAVEFWQPRNHKVSKRRRGLFIERERDAICVTFNLHDFLAVVIDPGRRPWKLWACGASAANVIANRSSEVARTKRSLATLSANAFWSWRPAIRSASSIQRRRPVFGAGPIASTKLRGRARETEMRRESSGITAKSSGTLPRHALYLSEGKVGTSTFDGDLLRIAGIFDLTGIDETLKRKRIDAIVRSSAAFLKDWEPGDIELDWAGRGRTRPTGCRSSAPSRAARASSWPPATGAWGSPLAR